MSLLDEIREERLKKIGQLAEHGLDAYPAQSKHDLTIGAFLADFESLEAGADPKTLAGRIMTLRRHGGLIFADLFDGTARIQTMFQSGALGESFELFVDTVDTGDFVNVTGVAHTSKRGEKSLLVSGWRMLTKSLTPIPDEWYGIKDEDDRFRKRYLDILLNEDVADTVRLRSKFWNTIRQYLLERDFIEVDTPVLENTTGGADARPFVTHHNALDIDVYLRISAGELWQKRLMIAGIPRTFEIGRIFRNEGMSNEHLQDYTQMECYMAYADYRVGMTMAREMYIRIAEEVFGTTKFTIRGFSIDLSTEWETYDYVALLKEHFDINPLETTPEKVSRALEAANIAYEGDITLERGVDLLWKHVRRSLSGPGFLINVPVYMEPLAKRNAEDPRTVERFQIILAGSEMGKGFSELNDPIDQRQRFLHQQALRDAGDDEAQMADLEYVEALEYGMPPTFGFGVSERLFSFLLDKNIREAQIFPLMRPKE